MDDFSSLDRFFNDVISRKLQRQVPPWATDSYSSHYSHSTSSPVIPPQRRYSTSQVSTGSTMPPPLPNAAMSNTINEAAEMTSLMGGRRASKQWTNSSSTRTGIGTDTTPLPYGQQTAQRDTWSSMASSTSAYSSSGFIPPPIRTLADFNIDTDETTAVSPSPTVISPSPSISPIQPHYYSAHQRHSYVSGASTSASASASTSTSTSYSLLHQINPTNAPSLPPPSSLSSLSTNTALQALMRGTSSQQATQPQRW